MRLIDANALIKRIDTLKHQIAGPAAGFVAEDSYECGAVDALCDAKMYAEEAPTIGGWISVKDRLPEQVGCRCLVSAEYGDGKRIVFTAFTGYGEPRWWTYDISHMEKAMYADNHVHHNYHITHWMPLPESPKEET